MLPLKLAVSLFALSADAIADMNICARAALDSDVEWNRTRRGFNSGIASRLHPAGATRMP